MPQIFHPSMNTIARVSIFGAIAFLAGAVALMAGIVRSPWLTEVGVVRDQPVPFSHEHHVGEVGLDCRYCHTSVENSYFAGMPSSEVCMDCHSQLWTEAEILEPVRESYRSGKPLSWTRVHDVPDYAYFDHSIHVHKGVACAECHGQVDQMPLMFRSHTLHMQWCLDCHRDPLAKIGAPTEPALVYGTTSNLSLLHQLKSGFDAEADEAGIDHDSSAATDLTSVANGPERPLQSKTSCSTCHR